MSVRSRIILRALTTVLATLAAFPLGAYLGGMYCQRFVVPGWVVKYPHDGQIGLGVFVYAGFGAMSLAIVVFVCGCIWTARTAKRLISEEEQPS